MKSALAVLAAALLCASAALGGSARAQQAVRPPAPSAARPRAQAIPNARTAHEPAAAVRPPPVYRVELIVFRATSALGAPEDWALEAGTAPVTSSDADPGGAEASGAQASSPASSGSGAQPSSGPASSAAPNGVVRILPASEFELDGVASRLRASGRYAPVAHFAWSQIASPWGKAMEIPLQSVGLDAQGITGTVALERGVYLHLALDLRYTMSDPPPGLDAPPGTVFVLAESHRVRLKERNYFDHPAFGVIALVTSDEVPGRRAGPAPRTRRP